jgi:hypothetical protein
MTVTVYYAGVVSIMMKCVKTKQKIMVVIGGVFFYWMLPRPAPAPRSRAIFSMKKLDAPAPFSLTGKLKYFFIFILYDTLYSRE